MISGVSGIGLAVLTRSVIPFLLPLIVVLLLLIFFPALVTFLPDFLLGKAGA